MFVPYDLHFGAQIVCAHEDTCLGLLTLFRSKDSQNFSDKEIFFLDSLKEHLSIRLFQDRKQQNTSPRKSISWFRETYCLTHREEEILELLLDGLENEQIAEKLCISENTLRRHIYNLYGKLNIQHRWQLHFLDREIKIVSIFFGAPAFKEQIFRGKIVLLTHLSPRKAEIMETILKYY